MVETYQWLRHHFGWPTWQLSILNGQDNSTVGQRNSRHLNNWDNWTVESTWHLGNLRIEITRQLSQHDGWVNLTAGQVDGWVNSIKAGNQMVHYLFWLNKSCELKLVALAFFSFKSVSFTINLLFLPLPTFVFPTYGCRICLLVHGSSFASSDCILPLFSSFYLNVPVQLAHYFCGCGVCLPLRETQLFLKHEAIKKYFWQVEINVHATKFHAFILIVQMYLYETVLSANPQGSFQNLVLLSYL